MDLFAIHAKGVGHDEADIIAARCHMEIDNWAMQLGRSQPFLRFCNQGGVHMRVADIAAYIGLDDAERELL